MEPGDQIDIWVVERALGSGGMGSVYRCHNADAERILSAIKVLDPSLAASEEAKARFIREAEILHRLDHPNIVRVRNVRMDASPPYLEMEFVIGTSLEERIRQGKMPIEEALDAMDQIADALAYLHGQNVRHRDIKPANVLITERGQVKLVDFGLAVETDAARITKDGVSFGTVAYVPPEWVDPTTLEPTQWDLYAIGVVFFEMLTGADAFRLSGEGPIRKQMLQLVLAKQRAEPLDPGEQFPDGLRALIRDLTRVDPDDRPRSAVEVRQRLAVVRAGLEASNWAAGAASLEPTAPPRDRKGSAPPQTTLAPTSSPPEVMKTGLKLGVGAMIGLLAAIGLIVVVAVGMRQVVVGPTRDAVLTVEGLPDGMPVDVRLAGRPGTVQAARQWTFTAPIGTAELAWAAGEGCTVDACPGDDCPGWCGAGTAALEVEAGEGPAVLSWTIDAPAPQLTIRVPRLDDADRGGGPFKKKEPWKLRARLGDRRAILMPVNKAVFEGVPPGMYSLVVTIGTCPDDALACWPGGTCPAGCSSMREDEVLIPWSADPILREVKLPVPAE